MGVEVWRKSFWVKHISLCRKGKNALSWLQPALHASYLDEIIILKGICYHVWCYRYPKDFVLLKWAIYIWTHMGAQFELRCDATLSLFEAYQDAVRSVTGILKSTHLSQLLLCIWSSLEMKQILNRSLDNPEEDIQRGLGTYTFSAI